MIFFCLVLLPKLVYFEPVLVRLDQPKGVLKCLFVQCWNPWCFNWNQMLSLPPKCTKRLYRNIMLILPSSSVDSHRLPYKKYKRKLPRFTRNRRQINVLLGHNFWVISQNWLFFTQEYSPLQEKNAKLFSWKTEIGW